MQASSGPASSVVTIDPVRILDTRTDVGLAGPFVSGVSQKLQVTGSAVPAGASGLLLNVTVVAPTANGFLSVRPGDATGAPSTSSLNVNAGDIVPNAVQVGLPTSGVNAGKIDITFDAYGVVGPTTEVLIDVVGYMVAGGGGATGPAGPTGPTGPAGPVGPAGPLSSRCGATLRWDLTACKSTTVTVGNSPDGVAFDGSNIWVTNFGPGNVSKINPVTNTVTATVTVGINPLGVAFDGGNIWVTNSGSDSVSKINPVTNTVTATIAVGTYPQRVAFDGSNIWVANEGSGNVSRLVP